MTYPAPNLLSQQNITLALDHVMQSRKTIKALGDKSDPPPIPEDFSERVHDAMCMAGWAPFHYPAHASHRKGGMNSAVPWRFYSLTQADCLHLADYLIDQPSLNIDEKYNVIRMLSACGALVLVTWLPEPKNYSKKKVAADQWQHMNEEHLAAASAATQNLLLAAKAREIDTYWSSGGVLKSSECFQLCNIPEQERLLGAIFMLPELPESVKVLSGKLRNQRGLPKQWMKWVNLSLSS